MLSEVPNAPRKRESGPKPTLDVAIVTLRGPNVHTQSPLYALEMRPALRVIAGALILRA